MIYDTPTMFKCPENFMWEDNAPHKIEAMYQYFMSLRLQPLKLIQHMSMLYGDVISILESVMQIPIEELRQINNDIIYNLFVTTFYFIGADLFFNPINTGRKRKYDASIRTGSTMQHGYAFDDHIFDAMNKNASGEPFAMNMYYKVVAETNNIMALFKSFNRSIDPGRPNPRLDMPQASIDDYVSRASNLIKWINQPDFINNYLNYFTCLESWYGGSVAPSANAAVARGEVIAPVIDITEDDELTYEPETDEADFITLDDLIGGNGFAEVFANNMPNPNRGD